MRIENILFAIFSYNRGKYLRNCINSILENSPNIKNENIIIYDDNSDHVETIEILDSLKEIFTVKINTGENPDISRRGLYHNMNKALQDAIAGNFEYIFFIQEDLQFVRKMDVRFLSECEKIFESDCNIIQIQPLFFKGTIKEKAYREFIKINDDAQYYYGNNFNLYGIADIGLTKVRPLREDHWKFEHEETVNMKKGTEKGWMYVKPKNPLMMYLPWPETYRYKKSGKDKGLTRFLDVYYKTDFHPYRSMTDEMVLSLVNRNVEEYPIAEKFLDIKGEVHLKKPWNYVSTKYYVLKKVFTVFKKVHLFWIIEGIYKSRYKKQVRKK